MQESQLSVQTQHGNIPSKWQERFILKRINEEDIEISLAERNGILKAMQAGLRFVQIRKYTLMLNTLKSIEPKWGEENIPPRPMPQTDYLLGEGGSMKVVVVNQRDIDDWDRCFSDRQKLKQLNA